MTLERRSEITRLAAFSHRQAFLKAAGAPRAHA
jgi:hypothetical protein